MKKIIILSLIFLNSCAFANKTQITVKDIYQVGPQKFVFLRTADNKYLPYLLTDGEAFNLFLRMSRRKKARPDIYNFVQKLVLNNNIVILYVLIESVQYRNYITSIYYRHERKIIKADIDLGSALILASFLKIKIFLSKKLLDNKKIMMTHEQFKNMMAPPPPKKKGREI